MREFDVVATAEETEAVIAVAGELDMHTAPRLREQLLDVAVRGVPVVTVDLSEVDFVDSTGLGVLVGGFKRLREYGGQLNLRSPTPTVLKVLEMTGLTKVFIIT